MPKLIISFVIEMTYKINQAYGFSVSAVAKWPNELGLKAAKIADFLELVKQTFEKHQVCLTVLRIVIHHQNLFKFYSDLATALREKKIPEGQYLYFPVKSDLSCEQNISIFESLQQTLATSLQARTA